MAATDKTKKSKIYRTKRKNNINETEITETTGVTETTVMEHDAEDNVRNLREGSWLRRHRGGGRGEEEIPEGNREGAYDIKKKKKEMGKLEAKNVKEKKKSERKKEKEMQMEEGREEKKERKKVNEKKKGNKREKVEKLKEKEEKIKSKICGGGGGYSSVEDVIINDIFEELIDEKIIRIPVKNMSSETSDRKGRGGVGGRGEERGRTGGLLFDGTKHAENGGQKREQLDGASGETKGVAGET